MDITQLILDDHHEQRRFFAFLEEIEASETKKLTAIWRHLAAFLLVHAEAEERFFYPELLHLGHGAGGQPTADDETADAIKDHNELRDHIAAVAKHDVGSADWFEAIAKTNKGNSDHMGEEEREGLTDFRRHAGLPLRHDLGANFVAFEAEHITGVAPVDKDPKTYIAENK